MSKLMHIGLPWIQDKAQLYPGGYSRQGLTVLALTLKTYT